MPNRRSNLVQVEVLYARPGNIWRRHIELPATATVGQALETSGLLECYPELGTTAAVGIFGRACTQQQPVQAGDRIEVYRPLVFDPMESRRRRARHKQQRAALLA